MVSCCTVLQGVYFQPVNSHIHVLIIVRGRSSERFAVTGLVTMAKI